MSFIIALIAGIVVALFAGFNNDMVSINFIFAKQELSLAIIILISATIGAFAMYIMNLIKMFKLKKKIKLLAAKLTELGVDVSLIIGKTPKQVRAEKKAEQKARKQAEKEAKKLAKQQAKEQAKQKPAVVSEPVAAATAVEPAAPKTVEKPIEEPQPVEAPAAEPVEPAVATEPVQAEPAEVESKKDDLFDGEV